MDAPRPSRLRIGNWRREGVVCHWGSLRFWIPILHSKEFVLEVWPIWRPRRPRDHDQVITGSPKRDHGIDRWHVSTRVTLKLFSLLSLLSHPVLSPSLSFPSSHLYIHTVYSVMWHGLTRAFARAINAIRFIMRSYQDLSPGRIQRNSSGVEVRETWSQCNSRCHVTRLLRRT